MTKLFVITLGFVLLFSGCRAASQTGTQGPIPSNASANESVEDDIARAAGEAKGKVGVAAIDLDTGEYIEVGGHEHYPMQSVYKLPISLAVIKEYEDSGLDLQQKVKFTKADLVTPAQHSPLRDKFPDGAEISVRELIRYALEESDGTASDVLMRVAGGPQKVQAYLTSIGITDMKVLNTEKEIGSNWKTQYDNWSTPKASIDLLRALSEGRALASKTGHETVLKMMTNSTPGANRIRGMIENGTVAHKTGTSGTQNGITAATNDLGIVTMPDGKRVAIAIFVSDSPADEKTREAVIAKIAKIICDHWQSQK